MMLFCPHIESSSKFQISNLNISLLILLVARQPTKGTQLSIVSVGRREREREPVAHVITLKFSYSDSHMPRICSKFGPQFILVYLVSINNDGNLNKYVFVVCLHYHLLFCLSIFTFTYNFTLLGIKR